ncbi:MAG: DUF58 domain-containing protein [Lentisphaerae bacterium]|nr:DUF58 domain-containing protein [Lentisphaerota bacterium]
MLPAELARQIRLLEIRTDHLVEEITGGAYRSVFKGRGIEFDEVREYTTDDDVRSIDWNVSARMGTPYIKKFIEERELVVMLVVDLSASGDFGAAAKSKRQTAAELAALLAFSAGRNGDKVGLMLFTDQLELYLPPRSGRKHALRIIRELLAFQPHHRGTDIDGVLQETAKLMKKRGIVFLLSDLNDPEKFSTSLKLLKLRQDVVAIELRDPVETDFPLALPVVFEDAETGEIVEYSGNREQLNAEISALEEAKTTVCRRAGVDLIPVTCAGDVLKPLIGFFADRRRRMRR